MKYSQKKKFFLNFFFIVEIYIKFWTLFQKKKNVITDLFPKLRTPKKVFKKISKKSCFRGHFENRHGEPEEPLFKSIRRHVYHIYWWLCRQLCRKKPLLLIWKVLKLLVNALIKVQFQRTLWEATWYTARSTVKIWKKPILTVIDHFEGWCVAQNLSYWY